MAVLVINGETYNVDAATGTQIFLIIEGIVRASETALVPLGVDGGKQILLITPATQAKLVLDEASDTGAIYDRIEPNLEALWAKFGEDVPDLGE